MANGPFLNVLFVSGEVRVRPKIKVLDSPKEIQPKASYLIILALNVYKRRSIRHHTYFFLLTYFFFS